MSEDRNHGHNLSSTPEPIFVSSTDKSLPILYVLKVQKIESGAMCP
jgi:hypothetical protein